MQLVDRLVARLESATVLDAVGDVLESAASPLAARRGVRDLLTGRWLGHSVHPMVVAMPMGCWLSATVLDLTGAGAAARRLVGTGVVSAVPAVATGSLDWLDTSGAERRVGVAHALVNDVSVSLFFASWLARRAGHHRAGATLSGAGLCALGAAGYLGGHLAYARGVGINTTAFQSGPDDWRAVIDVSDLTGGAVAQLDVEGLAMLAVRHDGEIHLLEDRCTHRGAPLSDGEVVDGCIECPWHSSRFALPDGSVRRGPASVPQPVYETRIVDGSLQIRRDEAGGLRANPVGAHGSI